MGQWDLSQRSLVADPGSVRGSGWGTHVAGQVWGGLAQTLRPPLGFKQRFV